MDMYTQKIGGFRFHDRYALEREQAPSPLDAAVVSDRTSAASQARQRLQGLQRIAGVHNLLQPPIQARRLLTQ